MGSASGRPAPDRWRRDRAARSRGTTASRVRRSRASACRPRAAARSLGRARAGCRRASTSVANRLYAEARIDAQDRRDIDRSESTERLVVVRPGAYLVALETVQPPDREVARRHEDLRVVAERRADARLVLRFALEVALVLQLHGPVPLDGQARGRAEVRLRDQRLVLALRQIAVAVDDVVEGAEVGAVVDDVGAAGIASDRR